MNHFKVQFNPKDPSADSTLEKLQIYRHFVKVFLDVVDFNDNLPRVDEIQMLLQKLKTRKPTKIEPKLLKRKMLSSNNT